MSAFAPPEVTKDQRRHLSWFLSRRSAVDLLALKVFPNPKEITESVAAYHAVEHYLSHQGFALGDRDTLLVAVGDGSTPRTAALFAHQTAWACHSVDPRLRDRSWRIDRLTLHRCRIEECHFEAERVVIVAVHAHVDLARARKAVAAEHVGVVAIPCCVPLDLDRPPDVAYEDFGIWSPHRTVKVWASA
jgi:hypothetical protein